MLVNIMLILLYLMNVIIWNKKFYQCAVLK